MPGRLTTLLRSRRAAIAAMLTMAAVLALASLVPADLDPGRLATLRWRRPVLARILRLHPERVASSPLFLLLPGLVFASTAFSIWERVRRERDRRGRPVALERFRATAELHLPGSARDASKEARLEARGSGYRLEGAADSLVCVVSRGGVGFAGSIVFHVGLLVVLTGVAVSTVTRTNAELLLAEGFPIALGPEAVLHPTRQGALERLRGTTVAMRDFTAEFARGFSPVDFGAVLELTRAGAPPRAEVVRVNEPVWVNGFQLTLYRYGFAPELTVTGRGGRVLTEGAALLRVLPPGTEDGLALPGGDELQVALYPDHELRGAESTSRSLAPVNPVLRVRWLTGGTEVAHALLRPGETASLGTGRVTFANLRYWADFQLGRDLGLPWIALGSALIALGLALRFLFDPQVLRFEATELADGCRLEIVATSRYFPALNEDRAERLRARLAARTGGETA